MIYLFVAVATLVGTPTAGAFVLEFNQTNVNRLIIFTGILIIAGALTLGLASLVPIVLRRRRATA